MRLEVRGRRYEGKQKDVTYPYTVPMIVDTAKLATPILWTAG